MTAWRQGHPLRATVIDLLAPVAVYYGVRGLGASVWVALIAGAALPAAGTCAAGI